MQHRSPPSRWAAQLPLALAIDEFVQALQSGFARSRGGVSLLTVVADPGVSQGWNAAVVRRRPRVVSEALKELSLVSSYFARTVLGTALFVTCAGCSNAERQSSDAGAPNNEPPAPIGSPEASDWSVEGAHDDEPDERGFRFERVASKLEQSVGLAFAPDGRLFVAEKEGRVRVIRDDKLLDAPFIDIRDEVNSAHDRGLLSIAVHPRFPSVPYVYLLYTYDPPELRELADGMDGHGARGARLVRVEADPARDYEQALPGSSRVLLGGGSTFGNIGRVDARNDYEQPSCGSRGAYVRDCLPADEGSHTIGTLAFGPDGMLYVSNGDGCDFVRMQPSCTRALDVDSLAGKILRIDPESGAGLPDNPFAGGDLDENRAKVYQLGLRNPFRFSIDPVSAALYVGDVGWNDWEEINRAGPGANFGWPCYEGGNGIGLEQPAYRDQARCAELRASGEVVTAALFSYSHFESGEKQGSAVLVGPVYREKRYPAPYRGALFYADYERRQLRYLSFDEGGNVASTQMFANATGYITQMVAHPITGDIYLTIIGGAAERPESTVERLVFTGYGPGPMADKFYTLRSLDDGRCVQAVVSQEGEPQPEVRDCSGGSAQRWLLENAGGQLYALRSESLGLRLTVAEQEGSARLSLENERHEGAQQFFVFPQGGGYQIISQANDVCVGTKSGEERLSARSCASTPGQLFQIASESNFAPTLEPVEGQTGTVGAPAVLQLSAHDPEQNDLTYFARNLPRGLSIDPHSGFIMGTLSAPGVYTVSIRVSDGELSANTTFLWRVLDTNLPEVIIEYPAEGSRYAAGALVRFSGGGREPSGALIPPERLTWTLRTHHNQHIHVGGLTPLHAREGEFFYADHGENTAMELCLQAIDSQGRKASLCRLVLPWTVEYTIDTEPSGLTLPWEGSLRPTPIVVQTHAGALRDLTAPLVQSGMTFAGWSHGGPASQRIRIGTAPETLVAKYTWSEPEPQP